MDGAKLQMSVASASARHWVGPEGTTDPRRVLDALACRASVVGGEVSPGQGMGLPECGAMCVVVEPSAALGLGNRTWSDGGVAPSSRDRLSGDQCRPRGRWSSKVCIRSAPS
jgi:hypothetical protein